MFKKIAATLFCLGIILRLVSLLFNRSLWCDEALLSMNILQRSYWELLQPLDNEQSAPILFLFVEKFMFVLFGKTDFALRIFPFSVSLVSLFLFFRIAIKILGKTNTTLIILLFYSSSIFLLRYALEVKQYQVDMLLSLIMLNLIVDAEKNYNSLILKMVVFGIIGIWFSNITIILLTTLGIFILYTEFYEKKQVNWYWVGVFASWAASFLIYFKLFIYNHPAEAFMKEFWNSYFPPVNIFSKNFLTWFLQTYKAVTLALVPFISMLNPIFYVFFILVIIGIYDFYRGNKKVLFFLVSPLVIHFLLAIFKKYPIADKFILYTIPMFYILFAKGIECILKLRAKYSISLYAINFLYAIAIIVCFTDLMVRFPYKHQEIKKVLKFVKANAGINDKLVINSGCKEAFGFYTITKFKDLRKDTIILDRYNNVDKYITNLDNRVSESYWLILSHFSSKMEDSLLHRIKYNQRVSKFIKAEGSSAYLIVSK